MNYLLISAGECSVCRDAGDAVFVRRVSDGELFFACPDCGCAWRQPPTPGVVDAIDSLSKFAVDGWTVATREEIDAAGMAAFVWRECHFNEAVFDDLAGFSRLGLAL